MNCHKKKHKFSQAWKKKSFSVRFRTHINCLRYPRLVAIVNTAVKLDAKRVKKFFKGNTSIAVSINQSDIVVESVVLYSHFVLSQN
jgi:hypothetical protein